MYTEVINLTGNKAIIYINLTKNSPQRINAIEIQSILEKVTQSQKRIPKVKKMYQLASRNNGPIKERLHAARRLKKYLNK
jgi:hypothetical protein